MGIRPYEAACLHGGATCVLETALRSLDARGVIGAYTVDGAALIVSASLAGELAPVEAAIVAAVRKSPDGAAHAWDIVKSVSDSESVSAISAELVRRHLLAMRGPPCWVAVLTLAVDLALAAAWLIAPNPATILVGVPIAALAHAALFTRRLRRTPLGDQALEQAAGARSGSPILRFVFDRERPSWLAPPCCG